MSANQNERSDRNTKFFYNLPNLNLAPYQASSSLHPHRPQPVIQPVSGDNKRTGYTKDQPTHTLTGYNQTTKTPTENTNQ